MKRAWIVCLTCFSTIAVHQDTAWSEEAEEAEDPSVGESEESAEEDAPPAENQDPETETPLTAPVPLEEEPSSTAETEDEAPEPAPELTEEEIDIRRAYLYFQAGIEMTQRELWEAALAEFETSAEIHPTCATLVNIGLCNQRLRRWRRALDSYQAYLDECPPQLEQERARVRQSIDSIRSLVTEVRLDVVPTGATISIESEDVGQSPLAKPLLLVGGQHRVEVRMAGYRTHSGDIIVRRDQRGYERIVLDRIRDTGVIRISSAPPGATLVIDDHDAGTSPFVGQLRPGVHLVTASLEGFREETETITIVEGSERDLTIRMRRNRLRQRWFWTIFGVTALSAVTFAALGGTALSYHRRGQDLGSIHPNYHDVYHTGRNLMIATDVMLAITVVHALSTLIMGLFTDWSRPSPRDEGPEQSQD